MLSAAYKKKIGEIRKGATPHVLDLFSGCGGLSLGFHTAGFEIRGAIELDQFAAKSHAANFYREANASVRERHSAPVDITALSPEEYVKKHLDRSDAAGFDVICGGPPCQAYARVGRSKLREIAAHPEAFLKDPRSNLYLRFLAYVRAFKPLAILMENVPDVLNHGGHNVAEETSEVLRDLGYEAKYTLLNSVYYGVPEMRERMFLIAYRQELGAPVVFPKPTHWIDLPRGYEGSRQVALQTVRTQDLFDKGTSQKPSYTPPPQSQRGLPPAVTAQEAIGDLPPITAHLEGRLKRGARRFDELTPLPESRHGLTEYARLMREWPGFELRGGVFDHVIRSQPRDYPIFRRMNPGNQYPEAYRHALDLFEEQLRQERKKGRALREGTPEYATLRKAAVPPYDAGKFPNKWRKMEADKPARTLMAHLGKDGYSHIHYDSEQARTISVREAARLQSFPDGFVFCGTMNPAFRQIGNAVPPLMAKALATVMMQTLRGDRT